MEILQWITREEEHNLPDFKSHREAIEYFKGIYGDRFVVVDTEDIGGRICYFCRLITNPATYEKGISILSQGKGYSDGGDFISSNQPIEIWEDGRIHIIH